MAIRARAEGRNAKKAWVWEGPPGWIPGDTTQDVQKLATEFATLSQENRSLRDQLEAVKKASNCPFRATNVRVA